MITASVSVSVETSGPLHDGLLAAVAVGHPLTPARKQKQQLSHLISSTHCTQDHTLALILHTRVNLSMVRKPPVNLFISTFWHLMHTIDDFMLKKNIFTLFWFASGATMC